MVKLGWIDVGYLIGKQVANKNDHLTVITSIRYEIARDQVWFFLSDVDLETGEVVPDSESGVNSLEEFTVVT